MTLTQTIERLITNEVMRTQGDLVARLNELGVAAQQSSVSRALAKLGAMKSLEPDGTVRYRLHAERYIPQDLVTGIQTTETLLILNTRTGAASHIAQLIDELDLKEKAGTLAGDNAIFIAPRRNSDLPKLYKSLSKYFGVSDS